MLGSMPWSSPWLAEILGVNPMMGPLSEICKRSFCISCLFPVDMIQVCDPQFPTFIGDHRQALRQQQQASSHQDISFKHLKLQTHGYYRQHRRHEQL